MSVLQLYVHTIIVRSVFDIIAPGTELTVSIAQHNTFCVEHTIVQGYTSVPKIVEARMVAGRKCHTEDPQMLGVTVKNLGHLVVQLVEALCWKPESCGVEY
jgi:hypothetical protein